MSQAVDEAWRLIVAIATYWEGKGELTCDDDGASESGWDQVNAAKNPRVLDIAAAPPAMTALGATF